MSSVYITKTKGAFHWDDSDQSQWCLVSWTMVLQMNHRILKSQGGIVSSFDLCATHWVIQVISSHWSWPIVCIINTNEIPGELSRENIISWHVKITCYLHTWKDHHCYGYIINHAFHSKSYLSEMVQYFIGVYIHNK